MKKMVGEDLDEGFLVEGFQKPPTLGTIIQRLL